VQINDSEMVEFQRITCASSLGDSFNKESTEGVLKNQTGKQTKNLSAHIRDGSKY
jgi:hypothetical protein